MTDDLQGIDPPRLDDEDLRRELAHLHSTRHDTMLGGSRDALATHTRRTLAMETEFLRRFPDDGAPDPLRTRAGSRHARGQE
jgi:hypothetical protein